MRSPLLPLKLAATAVLALSLGLTACGKKPEGGMPQGMAAEVGVDIEVLSSGVRYSDEEMHVFNFDSSGEVVRFRHYIDTAKHIEMAAKKG